MKKKQYAIIGLGRFGASIAKTLYELGNEVLAVDKNEKIVQEISEHVTYAVQADGTDEKNLKSLGIRNFDVAIIAMASDVQANIMTTILIKEMGIKYVVAKASNGIHAKVLEKIGVDKIVFPEVDMGVRVANNLVSSNIIDYIELSQDYRIIEILCLNQWVNKTIKELNIRLEYKVTLIAIKNQNNINISPDSDDILQPDDILMVLGKNDDLNKLKSRSFQTK